MAISFTFGRMGQRLAVWLDDDLEKRLNQLFEAMEKKPELRDLGITKSAVVKAALLRGLPFLELDHMGEVVDSEWLADTSSWLTMWLDNLDMTKDKSE